MDNKTINNIVYTMYLEILDHGETINNILLDKIFPVSNFSIINYTYMFGKKNTILICLIYNNLKS